MRVFTSDASHIAAMPLALAHEQELKRALRAFRRIYTPIEESLTLQIGLDAEWDGGEYSMRAGLHSLYQEEQRIAEMVADQFHVSAEEILHKHCWGFMDYPQD